MIVQAKISDLPRLSELAKEFYAASSVLREFNLSKFVMVWTNILNANSGVIFLLMEGEEILGTLGGVMHFDPYCEDRIAVEFFWFVSKQNRGGGIGLYRRFEQWARENGCQEIRMMHLVDSMPDKVADFYCRVGFRKVETLYAKRLDVAELRRTG